MQPTNHVVIETSEGKTHQVSQYGNTVPVDDRKFLEILHENHHLKTGILPPVVRWISGSKRYVLLERPPMFQTITFHAAKPGAMSEAVEHTFSLPIPWTLYAIELGQNYYPEAVSAYAIRNSVRSGKEPLGVLPLPNHYNSGGICLPPYNPEPCENVAQGINAAYRLAWHSGFNHDLNQAIRTAISHKRPYALLGQIPGRITALKMFKQWAKLSLDEVSKIQDWVQPHGYGAGMNMIPGQNPTLQYLLHRLQIKDQERATVDGAVIDIRSALAQAAL